MLHLFSLELQAIKQNISLGHFRMLSVLPEGRNFQGTKPARGKADVRQGEREDIKGDEKKENRPERPRFL